ncbi:MAG: ATP-binding protein [Proteobacteria bacterium]|nr:ATP-binding protein [Pseudomonadota bacterium]
MSEVSCRAVAPLLTLLDSEGIPAEDLIADTSLSLEVLRRGDKRIPWNDWAALCERIQVLVGGTDSLVQLMSEHVRVPGGFDFIRKVAALMYTPRDVFWAGTVFMGRNLFSIVQDDFQDLPDGRIQEVLRIPPPYRDSPAFFHIMRAVLIGTPGLIGAPDAVVEMELAPRRAVYTISPPPYPWRRRSLLRTLTTPFATRTAIEELSAQQRELKQYHDALLEANREIQSQARDLERVDVLGKELANHIEMEPLTDALVHVLEGQFSCGGLALWLRPLERPDLVLLRTAGERSGPPLRSFRLEAAQREVGRLDIWDDDQRPLRGRASLLVRLIPWIAIAVDNARSYEALHAYSELLQSRVQERTAELAATTDDLLAVTAERKRATEALKESQLQLMASERLASLGTLAAGIAHEINNPVSAIMAAAQHALACREEENGDALAWQALEESIRESKRCASIVRSVLQFSRDEPTEKVLADLNEVVVRAVALTRDYADENEADVEMELAPEPCTALVNALQIEQAVVNLVRNAVEAGGEERTHITVVTETGPRWSKVEVRDSGCGIDPETMKRIFDPFFTTRRNEGGSGLGLAVVHGIVSEHRGRLDVTSEPGRGTTFAIEFPIAAPKTHD